MFLFTAGAAGLLAGVIHALSGPDHLAAISPLTVASRQRSWLIGFRWGIGHALGVGLMGMVLLPLRDLLDLPALSQWTERGVGLMLIAVGVWGLKRSSSRWLHAHPHQHGDDTHIHVHVHAPHHATPSHGHTHAATAVGLFHGVAGTSHLVGILPTLALPSRWAAAAYLTGYGLGNLVSMGGFAWLLGEVSKRIGTRPYRAVLGCCSGAAIVLGLLWLFL